jgi:hypothetical protein
MVEMQGPFCEAALMIDLFQAARELQDFCD